MTFRTLNPPISHACVHVSSGKQRLQKTKGIVLSQSLIYFSYAMCSVIKELRARFDYFKSTGNDSKIPAGLQRVIYGTVSIESRTLVCGVLPEDA